MARILLIEIDVTSPAGAASTLRFCDRAIRPFKPSDPDRAGLIWDDRLITPPSLRRALFDDVASLSPGLGFGAMTLANADRGLDAYQGHAFGEVRVWRWTSATPFASSELILKGLLAQPGFAYSSDRPGQVSVALYDYRAELEGQLQTSVYAGTNGGGIYYEGLPDGLKGRVKPLAYGRLDDAHLPAPQVNAGVLAYQLHDGPLSGSEQVFDRGTSAGLADDGDYSGGAFDGAAPAAAHYATDLGRGLIKFNSSPVGATTFGVRGDASGSGYVETTGPVLARMLAKAGVPGGRIGSTVSALSSTAVVGHWLGDATAGRDAAAVVARSALAALLPDRQGVWGASILAPPAVTPDHVIATDEVIAIAADDTAPAPAGEVRVAWGKVWTTFKGADLAPGIRGTAAEARLAEEYRYAVAADAVAKARFPRTWRTITLTTALRIEADAIALAAAALALFGLRSDGAPRRMWKVTLELTAARLAVALGSTIGLTYPIAGINDRYLLIAEELLRPRRDQVVWTLWG